MALTAKKVYAILKRQISDMEAKLNSPVRYRGTVATADLLPLNPDIGDMYNIESKSVYGEAGMNVAWNGVVWDTMGAPIDMSLYIKSSELADWVKQQSKPTYTAEEVGALPADTKIPSKTSDLQNDSGFLTKVPDNYLSGTDKTLSVSGKAADAKTVGDKNVELLADILSKLDKNQGSENSGKIAGINESGDIVPMFPVGVEYNSETNCLEFGSDQKMELNQGIGLDSTLTKTGSAADAGATGKEINSLKEDKADKTALAKTDKKLDVLWKLNQGISYEFQTDETEAYQKTVPSGAKVVNVKSIGGKTIVWNQLNRNIQNSLTKYGISLKNNNDGSWTISGTCSISNDSSFTIAIDTFANKTISGHKYLVKADKYSDGNYGFGINGSSSPLKKALIIGYSFNPVIFVKNGVTVDTVTMRMNIFDLTQMFGSGNEPSTVEEFEAMFPSDYYPYNAGKLMSAPVSEVTYSDTKTQETHYSIPQEILALPGYGWSARNVRNEVNWENKQYIQRVASVDLGSLAWDAGSSTNNDYKRMRTSSLINIIKKSESSASVANILCSKYISKTANETYSLDTGISVEINGAVSIYDTLYNGADSVASFVTFVSGAMLFYELAKPIITDISDIIDGAFQEPLEVGKGGTLTFKNSHGDDYRIPVPSTEEYLVSLAEVAK